MRAGRGQRPSGDGRGQAPLPGPPHGHERLDPALWRAVGAFRLAALAYAAVSVAVHRQGYVRPLLGLTVLLLMAAWSAAVTVAYRHPAGRRRPVLLADLALAVAAQLSSVPVLGAAAVERGEPTLPVAWAAVPVAAWAVHDGRRGGALAGTVVGAGAVVERGGLSSATVNSCVLLLLLGFVVGQVVELGRRAEAAYAEAVHRAAVTGERDRLARQVHDGVLQTLALVSRGAGDPALAALATEQERALRELVAGAVAPPPAGESDLRALLPVGAHVQVAAPAEPVLLPSQVARELAAAVAAAVDNALRHGGGRAWLLVEDEPAAVTVGVRDDGPGIAPGRLERAREQGRLGMASSIRGRVADLGGTVTVTSTDGQGTEVELRVPRRAAGGGR